jgi:capsid protein
MPLLNSENINFDTETFNEAIESRFRVYANSTMCDYEGKRNLHDIMSDAWINKDVAGDVLIVLRLVKGMPKVKIIDGANVVTPLGFGTMNGYDIVAPNGNVIRYGVELDSKGTHIAYWVRRNNMAVNYGDFERIEARMNEYPFSERARLVMGLKYRLENVRGIPLITAVMETASKMARYREATIAGAEERAKIAYTIEHDRFSTGENPIHSQMAQASGFGLVTDLPTDSLGQALANKVAATVNKQVYNMPLGAKAVMHESKQEASFKDFYTVNFDILCAVAGYPPEVIMSKYDSNYSASRAAIKDFEHTLEVNRKQFASQTYQIVYNFCLDVWALSEQIDAPGYLELLAEQNDLGLAAYRNARWEGDTVPHIDPYKEVKAIREMLGEDAANFPLATMEQAVEQLGHGDYKAILTQYTNELKAGYDMGIEKAIPKGTQEQGTQPNGNPANKKDKKATSFFNAENILNGTV